MNLKNFKIYIIFTLLFGMGCTKDFLDINDDPNNPLEATYDLVLTNAQLNITTSLSMSGGGLSSFISVFTHQVVQRRQSDKYELNGGEYSLQQAWDHLYSAGLEDLEYIIREGTKNKDMIYVGIAKIMKAYAFSQMVDVWGDIPYSQANNMKEYRYPIYDNDADIYSKLFLLIDEGIRNIEDENAVNIRIPGEDDIIYTGDTELWIKFAKTLKLKLYNQIRLTTNVGTNVNAIINEGDIISDITEDFEVWYFNSATPENRNPGYYNEYGDVNTEFYISPWFYEVLKGANTRSVNFPNVTDPRIPYYWYNQLAPEDDAQNPTEYRDGGFISIYFGSDGVNQDNDQSSSATIIGLYPVGGKFDSDDHQEIGGSSGQGTAPLRLLTYYSTLFIRAELAQAKITSENARELLSDAIDASFEKVNQIAEDGGAPAIADTIIEDYRDAVLVQFDAANDAGKMEIIMTQKWIASFGYAIDQYTDYRRTGYPLMWDPNTMSAIPPEGDPVPTSCSRGYQLSIEWPTQELDLNSNAPNQKRPSMSEARVFWDIN